jgi:hypothetical protein
MAKQVLTNVAVTFGTAATDISAYVTSITLSTTANEVVTSAMGSSAMTRIQGMIDNSVTIELQQDYPTIEKLFWDAFTAGTAVPMTVKPNGTAAAGSANPQYAFSALPTSWTPVNGAIGDLATVSITYPISGAITKTGSGA